MLVVLVVFLRHKLRNNQGIEQTHVNTNRLGSSVTSTKRKPARNMNSKKTTKISTNGNEELKYPWASYKQKLKNIKIL